MNIQGIYVGTSKEAVEAYGAIILSILNSRAEQKTLRAALSALNKGIAVSNVNISNNHIDQPVFEPAKKDEE